MPTRRTLALPQTAIQALMEHRKRQAEDRLATGALTEAAWTPVEDEGRGAGEAQRRRVPRGGIQGSEHGYVDCVSWHGLRRVPSRVIGGDLR